MVYLEKFDKTLITPEISQGDYDLKAYLYKNLEKGLVAFVMPEDIESYSKNIKRNYKVGFLFDLLSEVYPSRNQTEKYHIISEKYHFWITYRQFRNIMDEYEKDRNKYLYKRSALCI